MADSSVEMQPAGKRTAAGPVSAWPQWTLVSCSHLIAAVLLLAVAIAAAVGLGQGDWYVREHYTVGAVGGYRTDYYGLRIVTSCGFEAGALPSSLTDTTSRWATCSRVPYRALRHVAPSDSDADSAESSYKHLEGAGAIIIVMLSLSIFFGLFGAATNFFHAFHYSLPTWFSNRERHQRVGRLLSAVALALELLAIIFWITIFPYKFVTDAEEAAYGDYVYYYTLGTGLGIQIAAVFLAAIAFAITGRNPHTHSAAASPSV
eukprot:TRINITY_DN123_c0_g1_i2.p1 TRINITY_DN123_c0_g1~~TRINITY_DN123_c0_g1_i2.p1  ORF type:complete len:261 (-),score=62.40 TRINITY_DN123_c0_g1_i2:311-1093(-)